MAITSYRFVSPGVKVQEIDESQLPSTSNLVGPTIIGRFPKGPSMRPVYITSKSQLVEMFGNPVPGRSAEDVWRQGNYVGTMYAGYAAQAWLTNTSAVNIIRLLGTQSPNATTAGKAGWQASTTGYTATDSGGGGYGLFVIPSASAGSTVTGTLAAVWYLSEGSITLSGTLAGTSATYTSGTNVLIQSNNPYSEFYAVVTTPSGTYASNFNFNKDSDKYIRRVFNTNPTLTNSDITAPGNIEYYWLGESFERSLNDVVGLSATTTYGFIAPLLSGTIGYNNFRSPARPAETGWIIGQDLTTNTAGFNPANQQKLFKLVGLDAGEWMQKNLKVSITDIKPPPNDFEDYGSFSVQLRLATDSDNNVKVVEQYTNVNLNPVSVNYIARKIGDKYVEWDNTSKRLNEYGTYNAVSKYVRVEMDPDVDAGAIDPTYLPFGFFGPPRVKRFTVTSGSATAAPTNSIVSGGLARARSANNFLFTNVDLTASILFPSMALRVSASDGAITPTTNAYFGITTGESAAVTDFDGSYWDMTRNFPSDFGSDAYDLGNEAYRENSFIFTLDDVSGSTSTGTGYVYVSGSRAAGTSKTAVSSLLTGSEAGYRSILTAGYDQFTLPLYNGFDGFDITEADPLRNTLLTSGTPTETNNYVYYTYDRAISTISDPETLVTDIVAIPGLTYEALTTKLVQTCENRADALAVIDLPDVYIPEHEQYYSSKTSRYAGTVANAVNALKARGLNSSYGATYYPWVQIRDTISNQLVFVPPSVVALGAMSYGQRTQELWFAPAGFTRGGLSEGRGGVPVLNVTQRLSSTDRDNLYEANINPIAQFPAEGIVIFGQKTLQVTPSALDRINVRRLLIYLKREISKIAATLLFDQNVSVTWSRFTGQVNPFLSSVKSRLGLSDYRVILDNTTTTPDLVDRNIMYAKVYLKPARAIEFIAIDFTISPTGASFGD